MSSHSLFSKRTALLAVLVLPASLIAAGVLSGCGMGANTAPGSLQVSLHLTGHVNGGEQPITGSTIKLWSVGGSGYGSAATNLLGANVVTTSNPGGDSSITGDYTCPTPATLVYLTASGGNPGLAGGTNNSAIELASPLGACGNLTASTNVVINEVTTAATAYALGQYFTTTFGSTSTDSFGAAATTQAQKGLTNAFATADNLVDPVSGLAQNVQNVTNGVGTVTITPEQTKLYTVANILASCVNTTGPTSANCATLFADVTPTSGTQPSDILQAAVDLSLNPASINAAGSTANITALYGLQTATSPFTGLTTQPNDWTIGITYGSNSVAAGAGMYLLDYPTYLAADASGNIWILNDATTSATGITNSVTELGPTGTPLTQVLTGSQLIGPAGIAIDPSGNVWVPNYGSSTALQSSVLEYTTSNNTNTFTTNPGPQRLAIDGQGNAFVLEPSYKGGGDLEEIPTTAKSGDAAATLATGVTTDFSNLAIDSNYTIWITGGGTGASGGTAGYPYVYQFLHVAGSPSYATSPDATTNTGGILTPEQSISVDNSNDVFIQNYGKETLSEISGTTTVTANANSPYTGPANLSKPEFSIVDGAGNLWTTDAAATTASPAGSVFESSNTGAVLSPTGFAHTYDEPYGIAIDPSGNVWVGAYSSSASATAQAFFTEIVGAAVPVVTPLAAGLPATPGGTSKLGARP